MAGVWVEGAVRGVDGAVESYERLRGVAGKQLMRLAYCTDAVLEAAEESQEAAAGAQKSNGGATVTKEAFSREDVRAYLETNMKLLRKAVERASESQPEVGDLIAQVVNSLFGAMTLLEAPGQVDLEDLERRLTILDEKLQAALMSHASE